MSDIFIHRYSLTPKSALNAVTQSSDPRHGLLIQKDGGYASIFPWLEFGDLPVPDQIKSLKGELPPTMLVQSALHFAELDAFARKQSKSIFEGLTIPPSHKLITDFDSLQKAILTLNKNHTFKIKLKNNFNSDKNFILAGVQLCRSLRLDANASYTFESFTNLWTALSDTIKEKIEFVEDPIPYDAKLWKKLSTEFDVPLAYDFYSSDRIGEAYNVRIIKPITQHYKKIAEEEVKRDRSLVITSTMDHPLGISAAAWVSATLADEYPDNIRIGGHTNVSAYQPDEFSQAIQGASGAFKPAAGTGFGFDTLLSNLAWEPL